MLKDETVIPLEFTEKILLVNPQFPIPTKSKNHKDYLPIGLLKIASWLHHEGYEIDLVYGNEPKAQLKFTPDEIWITSLFTYWSDYVVKSAKHYSSLFPDARLVIGGIYATLKPQDCLERTRCHAIQHGVHTIAEGYYPEYSRLNGQLDFQVVHASRGCIRRCKFCYTHIIEPRYKAKCSIIPEIVETDGKKIQQNNPMTTDLSIQKRGLVFYDNNFLANDRIEEIMEELSELKRSKKISWCEAQSGFDGRLLQKHPELAKLLRNAGFRVPRIAWDWGITHRHKIAKQIQILKRAGYKSKEIFVFMIYNWDIPYLEMEEKRKQCFKWKVQIVSCRYRPIDQLHDHYKPRRKGQTSDEYYIHERKGWDDLQVKQFRRNIREQNICVRHGFRIHVKEFETKIAPKEVILQVNMAEAVGDKVRIARERGYRYWNPARTRLPKV